jgi:hypothetical protein
MKNSVLGIIVAMLTISCRGMAVATADIVERIQRGESFLTNLFDTRLQLLPEYRGSPTYWLFHDNYLAAHVLSKNNADLSRRIRSTMVRFGVTNSGKIEIVLGEARDPLPFRTYVLTNVAMVEGKTIRTERVTTNVLKGWVEYADLLLLASMAQAEVAQHDARKNFDKAADMWDGEGFMDRAARHSGIYATYKLALYLMAAHRLNIPAPHRDEVTARLLAMQSSDGGWKTDYKESKPVGLANVETTCLALLALEHVRTTTSKSEEQETNPAVAAERKGVEFLKREVSAWSRENGCFSCHNNGDGARALYAAKQKGYAIPAEALRDTTEWIRKPDQWDNNKGDPGFSDKRLANIQFAGALIAAMEAGVRFDGETLRTAARKVAADQASDGSWPIDRHNPAGSPTTYGVALATYMAITVLAKSRDAQIEQNIGAARKWLQTIEADNVVRATTALMANGDRAAVKSLPLLRRAQTSDGGWGPYADSPPEVFDTALVLLALAEVQRPSAVKTMIRNGRRFLATQQNGDGSWPATTRPTGGDSYAQQVSTSGWAVLALLRTRE